MNKHKIQDLVQRHLSAYVRRFMFYKYAFECTIYTFSQGKLELSVGVDREARKLHYKLVLKYNKLIGVDYIIHESNRFDSLVELLADVRNRLIL
jgi:hypothetical protein